MKVNDANFFLLHIEKIVLGVCALILLIVVLTLVVGSPYAVKMSGKSVSPSDVPKKVRSAAEKLQQALNTSKGVDVGAVPDYTSGFAGQAKQPALSYAGQKLAPIGPLDMTSGIGQQTYPVYELPQVPVTSSPVAIAGYGTLARIPDARLQRKLLKLIKKEHKPYDFRYVSVAATFDVNQWKKNYANLPEDKRPPKNWFYTELAGVYLQREKLDPATGQWSKPEIIKPIPGQIAFVDRQYSWDKQQRENNFKQVTDHQKFVAEPVLPLSNPAHWRRPYLGMMTLSPRDQRDLKSLHLQVEQLKKQQDRLYGRMAELDQRIDQVKSRNGQGVDKAISRLNDSKQRVRSQLDKVQIRLYRQLYTRSNILLTPKPMLPPNGLVVEQKPRGQSRAQNRPRPGAGGPPAIGGPGGGVPGLPNNTRQRLRPQRPSNSSQNSDKLPSWIAPLKRQRKDKLKQLHRPQVKKGELRVWAHDLTVEPGQTYRYRVIVAMLNPLFHRGAVAQKQREKNFNRFVLAPSSTQLKQAGSWSSPVTVSKKYYIFLVGGSAQKNRARLEVWRLYGGIWRNKTFPQSVGDLIGGQMQVQLGNGKTKPVNMNTGDWVVDLTSNASDESNISDNIKLLYLSSRNNVLDVRRLNKDKSSLDRVMLGIQQNLRRHKSLAGPYASPQQRKLAAADQQNSSNTRSSQGNYNPYGNNRDSLRGGFNGVTPGGIIPGP